MFKKIKIMFKKIKRELKSLKECWDEVSEYHKSDGPSEPHEYIESDEAEYNFSFFCDYDDIYNPSHEDDHPNHPNNW